MNLHWKTCLST